ncbi:hypothetical protein COU76_04410 [Candidatus Peregrinibacteria bacterium CG10_big_fil_rev_8_21_14_0_10_49_10]|nr:MAG: hypothetical protein COU76_04410 [Candidatus Peregrinibacteria bacterium CG10_big_fil_rev_8_21_14_0_10_49_10]
MTLQEHCTAATPSYSHEKHGEAIETVLALLNAEYREHVFACTVCSTPDGVSEMLYVSRALKESGWVEGAGSFSGMGQIDLRRIYDDQAPEHLLTVPLQPTEEISVSNIVQRCRERIAALDKVDADWWQRVSRWNNLYTALRLDVVFHPDKDSFTVSFEPVSV